MFSHVGKSDKTVHVRSGKGQMSAWVFALDYNRS